MPRVRAKPWTLYEEAFGLNNVKKISWGLAGFITCNFSMMVFIMGRFGRSRHIDDVNSTEFMFPWWKKWVAWITGDDEWCAIAAAGGDTEYPKMGGGRVFYGSDIERMREQEAERKRKSPEELEEEARQYDRQLSAMRGRENLQRINRDMMPRWYADESTLQRPAVLGNTPNPMMGPAGLGFAPGAAGNGPVLGAMSGSFGRGTHMMGMPGEAPQVPLGAPNMAMNGFQSGLGSGAARTPVGMSDSMLAPLFGPQPPPTSVYSPVPR